MRLTAPGKISRTADPVIELPRFDGSGYEATSRLVGTYSRGPRITGLIGICALLDQVVVGFPISEGRWLSELQKTEVGLAGKAVNPHLF
jgi:hypothetical protein